MNERFKELLTAAEAAGETPASPEEARELEDLWNHLDTIIASERNLFPELTLRHAPGQSRIEETAVPDSRRSRSTRLFFWSAGIAAIVTFGVMLFQVWVVRSAYDELQRDLREMQTSVILASLKSDSAADRLDGLFQVANGQIQSEPLVKAVLHRLSADPSINIRLASVRALAPYAERADVLASLRDAARMERSPLVLLDILELIRDVDPEAAETLLQDLLNEDGMVQYLQPGSATEKSRTTTNL